LLLLIIIYSIIEPCSKRKKIKKLPKKPCPK
jgi:hypothetical protein